MISCLKVTRSPFLAVIFVVEKAWLWSISLVGVMGGGIRGQSQTILTFRRSIWKTENLLFAIVSGR